MTSAGQKTGNRQQKWQRNSTNSSRDSRVVATLPVLPAEKTGHGPLREKRGATRSVEFDSTRALRKVKKSGNTGNTGNTLVIAHLLTGNKLLEVATSGNLIGAAPVSGRRTRLLVPPSFGPLHEAACVSSEFPPGARALALISGLIAEQPEAFPQRRLTRQEIAAGAFRGWRAEDRTFLIPAHFLRLCRCFELDVRQVLREWAAAGVLEHDPGRLSKAVHVERARAKQRFYVLGRPL
jgi:hypothetical protein